MNAPQSIFRKLRPGELAPMRTYDVFRQARPVELEAPDPKRNSPGVYRAVFVPVGEVQAASGSGAIELAKQRFDVVAPAVALKGRSR